MKPLAIAGIVLLLLGALAGALVLHQLNTPYRDWDRPPFVEIRAGTSSRGIAAQLRQAGVLRREWPFLLLHYSRPGRTLKAGEYQFDRAMSPQEVIGKLRRGEVFYHALTVPEGYNILEVAEAAAQTGLVTRDDMLAAVRDPALIAGVAPGAESLEGYLFPDTYHFTRHTPAAKMAAAMVARFRKVYRELEARHTPARPIRDIVILASLVEEETGVPGERPLVAGVYYNRLARDIPLQCDPTVIYAALLGGRYRGTIYLSDLKFESPYNTYVRAGLPPGPIANPGRASLEAAMRPADTDFLYFVKGENGGHRFSRTGEEHARNVKLFRRQEQRP